MLGAVDRSYTTAGHRQERQFDVWRDIVADAFVPVQLDSGVADAGSGFASACEVRRVGDVNVSWLRSASQRVQRTQAQTVTGTCGVYFLNFAVDRGSTAEQGGRVATLRPGDFTILDGDMPFSIEFTGEFEQITLTIPKAALESALIDARSVTALTIPGDQGIGAIAAAAFSALAMHQGRVDPRSARFAAAHAVGLLAAAIEAATPQPAARRAALFRALLEEVERNLGDADLSLRDVAKRIAISPSYATKLFAENSTSFGRWVLGRRLERAWMLLAGAPSTTSITDIALQCGFHDPAYFARVFRLRFGMTASERRRIPAPDAPQAAAPDAASRAACEAGDAAPIFR